jgi:hypothetical protein
MKIAHQDLGSDDKAADIKRLCSVKTQVICVNQAFFRVHISAHCELARHVGNVLG